MTTHGPPSTTNRAAWIVAGGLGVLAAVVIAAGFARREAERQEEVDRAAEVIRVFAEEILHTDLKDIDACRSALERLDKERQKWIGTIYETELTKMRKTLLTEARGHYPVDPWPNWREIESALADPEKLTTEELLRLRRIIDIFRGREPSDPSTPRKINGWTVTIDRRLIVKATAEAKAFAATNVNRQALQKYADAEDLVRYAVEDAQRSHNKEAETEFTQLYKALLEDSDALTAKVCTPAFIEWVPWKNLLTVEMAMRWAKTTNVPGFTFRLDNGIITMTPPDAASGMKGVASILDQRTDNLRHFVLEMDFAVEGNAMMFFHISPPPNPPDGRLSYEYDLNAKAGGLTPNQTYTLRAEYLGSTLRVSFPNDADIRTWDADPSFAKRRRGGIGFVLPAGTRLTITRMRIKDLR